MGFHPQPNDWTCGPFALKHALISLGCIADADHLKEVASTHWWAGTDENGLARAAQAHGCSLELHRKRSAQAAKKTVGGFLRKRLPVLLCVDDWGHWITVVGGERDQYVIIDSLQEPVINVLSWKALHRRWRYLDRDYDEEEPPELYEMYPLVPRMRSQVRANFSVARMRHLRRPENEGLASEWNAYLGDLLEICRPPSKQQGERLSMAEFLRRNQLLVIRRVMYWHGDVSERELSRLLHNFRFVAETYGLVIPVASARQAVADLAILVTMWVVADRGIGEVYGAGPR